MNEPGQIARRFPLVARTRPACQPLSQRVTDVRQLAQTAGETATSPLSMAAEAHNKAALIASDCGLPALARDLCWRQFAVYQRATPLTAGAAQLGLQPVVNLARLLIRGGDADGAYRLLDTIYHAVRTRASAVVDGQSITFTDFTASDEDHRALCQWLWTVLLADGTRALAGAGQWDQALAHATQHRGVGARLLDGRQVAVLARCSAGSPDAALAILSQSVISAPWEQAVAACLMVLCLRFGNRPADAAITAMVELYPEVEPAPGLLAFRTHLGLTVIDLAGGTGHPGGAQAAAGMVGEAVAAGDGYAARDILAHPECRSRLTETEKRALTAALRSSGLGRGTVPAHLMGDLMWAVETSETAIARNLNYAKSG
jgi:hypothetical protein